MDQHNDGTVLLGLTSGLWMMQNFLWLAGAMNLANLASAATIFSGTCAGIFWLYSLYKKMRDDRVSKKDQ